MTSYPGVNGDTPRIILVSRFSPAKTVSYASDSQNVQPYKLMTQKKSITNELPVQIMRPGRSLVSGGAAGWGQQAPQLPADPPITNHRKHCGTPSNGSKLYIHPLFQSSRPFPHGKPLTIHLLQTKVSVKPHYRYSAKTSHVYTAYQQPQYTAVTGQQPRSILVESPTSAGLGRRGTVRTKAPVNTSPQYSTGTGRVTRSASQSRPQRTHFAPLPQTVPLHEVPVVGRSGTRSRRSNSVNVSRQTNPDDLYANPYPTRSSTINYGSRTIGSQAPYDTYGRRATSLPPINTHPLRPSRELEDFNVGSATSAGRLYDEPHLPAPYTEYGAGSSRDGRRRGHRASDAYAYGDRYGHGRSSSSKGGSAGGHKGGGMFGWLVGHK
ncbi:hypothetical protein FRB90_004607 [Tulasnella sp. 427]|nr:hypothetical protein FRB90_004607 [Tulasnella sp. 427]